MFGKTVCIFGIEIIETAFGLQFGHAQSLVAQNRHGELAALDKGFGQQSVELLPWAL